MQSTSTLGDQYGTKNGHENPASLKDNFNSYGNLFHHLQLYYIRGFTDEVMGDVTGEIVPVVLEVAPQLHTVLATRVIWLSGAPICVGHGEVRLHPLEHAFSLYVVSAQPIRYVILVT